MTKYLLDKIEIQFQRLDWTPGEKYEHILKTYNKRSLAILSEGELLDLLEYLRSQPEPELMVTIPAGVFDQIERYLEHQAAEADGEASRLLMALEDLEISRVVEEETKKSETDSLL